MSPSGLATYVLWRIGETETRPWTFNKAHVFLLCLCLPRAVYEMEYVFSEDTTAVYSYKVIPCRRALVDCRQESGCGHAIQL